MSGPYNAHHLIKSLVILKITPLEVFLSYVRQDDLSSLI
ncbi:TPA: DUF2894 domain-containing protein [Enterococcus faecium]|nr:DUF2894 domain-containing protein [Enterococcus faecium]